MTLKEMLETTSWCKVEKALIELYPGEEENLDGYNRVFCGLRRTEPSGDDSIKLRFRMEEEDEYTDGPWPVLFGVDSVGQEVACGFVVWEDWLSWEFEEISFPNEILIAAALFEMTWYGFTAEDVFEMEEEITESYRRAVSEEYDNANYVFR